MNRTSPISGELLRLKEEIHGYAIDYGLDFYEVIFEMCDYDTINILASLGGFPNRYPHWKFGMQYDQMYKGYAYGMQKIYEMVVNTRPCYAYLLKSNNFVDQKIVMAHVYGHADFFKNNAWFASTNRNMMDLMANHGTKIRRYMESYGVDKVESFIDKVLSLENLLDVDALFLDPRKKEDDEDDDEHNDDSDVRSKALQSFMRSKIGGKKKKKVVDEDDLSSKKAMIDLADPTKDIMMFLVENAPLEEWQADVLGALREEAYYYLPQRMTKIMNEGWASYWHSTIMTKHALKATEIIDFADHHSGVMAMSRKRLNPYKLGIELFRDIEYRWNTGKFGQDYQACDDMVEKEKWNKDLGLGKSKIFEIRKTHNDITFIDEFLTPEFCERQQIFTYKYNPSTRRNEIDSKEFEDIKAKLLSQLTNFGTPSIKVKSKNFGNRGEILLHHTHYGVDLDLAYAAETMKNIYALWGRPVNIITKMEDKEVTFIFNGKEFGQLNPA